MSSAPGEGPDVIRGRCHCGDVVIALVPPTLMCGHCHCTSCRRLHAAAFVTWTAVPLERFHVIAGTDCLVPYASSPAVVRSFCARCGAHVVYVHAEMPGRFYVPVAVLDDPLDRKPDAHVNVAEAVPWCVLPADGLPRFPGFD